MEQNHSHAGISVTLIEKSPPGNHSPGEDLIISMLLYHRTHGRSTLQLLYLSQIISSFLKSRHLDFPL